MDENRLVRQLRQKDRGAQRATLTYRGVTVELFPENTAMVVDGEAVEPGHAPIC